MFVRGAWMIVRSGSQFNQKQCMLTPNAGVPSVPSSPRQDGITRREMAERLAGSGDARPWLLINLVNSLFRSHRQDDEANRVSRRALELARDNASESCALWPALDDLIDGNGREAAAHWRILKAPRKARQRTIV